MFLNAICITGLALLSLASSSKSHNTNQIPGIYTNTTNTFNCPRSTCSDVSLPELEAAMNDFARTFYLEKDIVSAFSTYVASDYIQHNPDISDGRDAAVSFLTPLFGNANNTFEIARVMVGNEYTTIHVRATLGTAVMNVYDVYRTQGSCIVEHWDCMQPVAGETVSTHPYF